MSDQLSLVYGKTIQQQFDEFHAKNPWVLETLLGMARQARNDGATRVGIGMLFEVIRWQHFERTRDWNSPWKLNNNYRSRYARKLIEVDPTLASLFQRRALRAA